MFKKRVLTALLIVTLVFSNASIAFANDNINLDNESEIEDQLDETTGDAIEEEVETTEEAVKPQPAATNSVAVMGTGDFQIRNYKSDGTYKKVNAYQTVGEANSALNAMYAGTNTTYGNFKGTAGLGLVVVNKSGKIINMKHGMAYFKSSSATVSFGKTYIPPNTPVHFYSSDGTNTTIGISGYKVKVATSRLVLIPCVFVNKTYVKDYYTKSSNGDLYHYVFKIKNANSTSMDSYKKITGGTSALGVFTVDKAPTFMKTGTRYYSADGVNFYTNVGLSAKAGTYYPYYKYLPYRTRSNYSSTSLNKWIKNNTKSNSKLRNQGRNLIVAQNWFGVNAVNELAFACLESGYGTSTYALKRNNLFGINAVDSNPNKATYFSSAGSNIHQHALRHLSYGYADAKSDSRYQGFSPGNKMVGVNVRYASDPWHGEKISGIAYKIDKSLGRYDYRKYKLGVTNKNSVNVYKKPGTTKLYNLSTKSTGGGPTGIPVVILGSSGSYYIIQSDLPISGNYAKYNYTYYFTPSLAYVKKSDINVINNGAGYNYINKHRANRDLRNLTVKVGSKYYNPYFDPFRTSYTVTVPKSTKKVTITGSRLMGTSKVYGNGTYSFTAKSYKYFKVKVKSGQGTTKTYTIKVVRKK